MAARTWITIQPKLCGGWRLRLATPVIRTLPPAAALAAARTALRGVWAEYRLTDGTLVGRHRFKLILQPDGTVQTVPAEVWS